VCVMVAEEGVDRLVPQVGGYECVRVCECVCFMVAEEGVDRLVPQVGGWV